MRKEKRIKNRNSVFAGYRFYRSLLILGILFFPFGLRALDAGGISDAGSMRETGLKVGYGKAVITPPLGTPCALGLDDDLIEVFDDLYVRAVWLESGDEKILLAAADIIELFSEDAAFFASLIAMAVSIPVERVVLHCTHTHQTASSWWEAARRLRPFGLDERFAAPEFRKILARGFVEAALGAKRGAEPCEMSYSESPVKDIASNRRVPTGEGDKVVMRSSRPKPELREKPAGKIDPLVRVILFRNLKDRRLIGIDNYNCHPSAAGGDEGPYATGDFPGAGMALAEKTLPGTRLLHLTGTCGEINPGKYVISDSLAPEDRKTDIRLMGERYGQALARAIGSARVWKAPDRVAFERRSFLLPLQKGLPARQDLEEQLAKAVGEYKEQKISGKAEPGKIRSLVHRLSTAVRARENSLESEAAALRLGDVFFAFLPGEIFLQFGDSLREHFGRPKLINASCTFDGGISYVVPPEAFAQGGYEPTATRLAGEAYGVLFSHVVSLLEKVGLPPE